MNYQTQLQAWQAREGAQASQKAPKNHRLVVWVVLAVIAVPALWVAFGAPVGMVAGCVALFGGIWINPNKGTGGLVVQPEGEDHSAWFKKHMDEEMFKGPTGVRSIDRANGWHY